MNEDWTITYNKDCGVESERFTANGILDAIQQCSEIGVSIRDIVTVNCIE